MTNTFDVKVFSPNGLMFEKESEFLRLPGKSGDIGVSVDHTPSLVECVEGEMVIKTGNQTLGFYITDSIAHIDKKSVTIIVDFLESIENIDKKRAESSKKRAEDRLDKVKKNQSSDIDVNRAKKSLNRAELRLEILLKHQLS